MWQNAQNTLHTIYHQPNTHAFRIVNDVVVITTLVSILVIILETVDALSPYAYLLTFIEYVAVSIFTVEYITRIIASKKKLSYVFSFFGIIDLLAIIPTYLSVANFTFLKAGRTLRILRFLRVLRLAKVTRVTAHRGVSQKEQDQLYKLNVQIYFAALFTAVIFLGYLIYLIEGDREAFSNIPEGMLWAFQLLLSGSALTSPQTIAGSVIMVIAQFFGLLLLGMLLDIVGKVMNRLIFGTERFYYNKADG